MTKDVIMWLASSLHQIYSCAITSPYISYDDVRRLEGPYGPHTGTKTELKLPQSCGQQNAEVSSKENTGLNMEKEHWNTQSVHSMEWYCIRANPTTAPGIESGISRSESNDITTWLTVWTIKYVNNNFLSLIQHYSFNRLWIILTIIGSPYYRTSM